MQILSAKIAPGGNETLVVVRNDLTPADIHILRKMHGYNAVRDIKVVGQIKRSSAEERQRLMLTYKAEYITAVFPSVAYPLPQEYEDEGNPDDVLYGDGESSDRMTAGSFSNTPMEDVAATPDDEISTFAEKSPAPAAPVAAPVAAPAPADVYGMTQAPVPTAPATKRRGNPEALAKARIAQAEKRAAIAAAKQAQ